MFAGGRLEKFNDQIAHQLEHDLDTYALGGIEKIGKHQKVQSVGSYNFVDGNFDQV